MYVCMSDRDHSVLHFNSNYTKTFGKYKLALTHHHTTVSRPRKACTNIEVQCFTFSVSGSFNMDSGGENILLNRKGKAIV